MHTFKFLFCILIVSIASQCTLSFSSTFWGSLLEPSTKANGDGGCAVCTTVFLLLSHVQQYYNVTSNETLPLFCSFLPTIFDAACSFAASNSGEAIAEQLESGESADVICHGLNYCYTEPERETCHLLPEPQQGFKRAIRDSIKRNEKWKDTLLFGIRLPDICNRTEFIELCLHIESALNDKVAVIDNDGDGFSTVDVLRGYNWRGFDCDENNTDAYPGRIPINEDRDFDSNCNGIWGVNPTTGLAYETELCEGSEQRGVIYFGDSVGAHFRAPPDLMDVTKFELGAWEHILYEISNELDWPELSFGTGHVNSTWSIVQNVSTNSVFWRLRNRNLCNNNDYHNRAYNGGRTSNILSNINFNTTRNRNADYPALVIYAQVGNDVCNGHEDTVESMTTPEEFRANVLEFFDHMEDVLPPGSHILTIGLLNGEVLRPSMSGHLHPIGYLNSDITYDLFYDWLNCLLVSPCLGWTSANESLRNETTQRANDLSAVLEELSNTQTYDNFDIRYFRIPVLNLYEQYGEQYYKLVEPVDGFHPNRIAQNIFAADIWAHINAHFPEFVGNENPLNPLIHSLFGL